MTFNLQETWEQVFHEECVTTEEDSGVRPEEWRTGGRVTKDKPNKEDGIWWHRAGLEFCENWLRWREQSGWRIWEVNGEPAIEIGGTANIAGYPVKCYIDRVFVTPTGELCILDLKSGARSPDSDLQLGIYACWLEAQFGVRPSYGVYWLARRGELSAPVSLDRFTTHMVGEMVRLLNVAVDNEVFIPNVGEHCRRCGVARACYAVGGELSDRYDPLDPKFKGGK